MYLPTSARLLSSSEWTIVNRVLGPHLPFRPRVFVTNGAGADNRPFTIPTSLVSSLVDFGPAILSSAFLSLLTANPLILASVGATSGLLAEVSSFTNLAYFMNVGPSFYPDLTRRNRSNQFLDASATLVHETMHVWQGKNSWFAMTYVFSSVLNQAFKGGGAYTYRIGDPWRSMNAEQQAKLVEDWYWRSGESVTDTRYPYIRDFVRKGIA
jgi:hypothetical protein